MGDRGVTRPQAGYAPFLFVTRKGIVMYAWILVMVGAFELGMTVESLLVLRSWNGPDAKMMAMFRRMQAQKMFRVTYALVLGTSLAIVFGVKLVDGSF